MKKSYEYKVKEKVIRREYTYIPLRYIVALLLAFLEFAAVIAIVVVCCYYIPYFYLAAYLTTVGCVLKIVSSDDNPDYKVPWLLCVILLPIVGFMLYFMFYSRKLKKKYIKRLHELRDYYYERDDSTEKAALSAFAPIVGKQVQMLTEIADTRVFTNTEVTYFPLGENMHERLLEDLRGAERFIYLEYFIIEQGVFWDSILEILREKAAAGVEVRVIYDDIGCMTTLPGNYYKKLKEMGIQATVFSILRGNADSEFNNRSHRKITVIDGKIGYTGGVNLADEYIGKVERFGHWKDTAVRLEGEAVWELTELFLADYGINVWNAPRGREDHYPPVDIKAAGFVVPFGDGPKPLYERRVGKSVIQNMLNTAVDYMYMTTPYLILDNDICVDIENAALRGVDVRIILPHIPDKKIVFEMSQSFYARLMAAGVKIYEYEPGFIHAKSYVSDDKCAMIGTINLDYRSLVHHFENGVWMYGTDAVRDIKADMDDTLTRCIEITPEMLKVRGFRRFLRASLRVFAPLM